MGSLYRTWVFFTHDFILLLSFVYTEHLNIHEPWKDIEELIEFGRPNNTDHETIEARPDADKFLLFTRKNQVLGQLLSYNNETSVTSSNFNPNVSTLVVVHGWLENRMSAINIGIKTAILRRSDVNVIIVDWSRFSLKNYYTATSGVPSVGRGLGQFLAFLKNVTDISSDSIHLVGFSLGGHVVGNAGRELDGQIARITALDPAGPLWYDNEKRLRDTDATYVEVIHTNAGSLGIKKVVGNVDFFPNGGSMQPGCHGIPLCNHERAWQLFASSINNRHLVGRQCANAVELFGNFCRGKSYPLGNNDLTKFGTGVYRLKTSSKYPF